MASACMCVCVCMCVSVCVCVCVLDLILRVQVEFRYIFAAYTEKEACALRVVHVCNKFISNDFITIMP